MFDRILNNGMKIPAIGMGTYPLKGEALENAMCAAVEVGYRLFDTAHSYGNEESFGDALKGVYKKTGVKREELFLETKVGEKLLRGIGDGRLFYKTPSNDGSHVKADVRAQVENSLKLFNTDYLDIVLIHWPYPDFLPEIWYGLEDLYKEGKIRAIGVSNFRERHLKRIMDSSSVIPAINQIEVSPLNTRNAQIDFCKANGIQVEVYSPLMSLKLARVKLNEMLNVLCAKYNCSLAQLILKWNVARGLLPIPKSGSKERLKQNFNLEFSLSEYDIEQITSLNENYQYLPESIYCPGF